MKKILIVDDEVNIGLLLSKFLNKHGYEVSTASTGAKAMEILKNEAHNLVLCDFRLEDADGKEMLQRIKTINPSTIVIIITGYSDVKMAVDLIKGGAYDYITKPLYPDEILNTINKAFEHAEVISSDGTVSVKLKAGKGGKMYKEEEGFIRGESSVARELYRQIDLVAPTNYSIILFGESGTGKEAVAHKIHAQSMRKDQPFVAMDCGSLSKELASSELFGHEKGSFTGAFQTKIGHFEMANGGTLFLDEVANLSYDIQVSLLRVVQERKVKRIGSTREIDLDVRLIVASNENLWEAVQKGRFREDLYHRFNEFSINIPALRNRGKDILAFAEYFLQLSALELNKELESFSDEVIACFLEYPWPGNVRELKNVIRRASLLTESHKIVEAKSLPLEITEMSNMFSGAREGAREQVAPREEENGSLKTNLKNAALEAEYETILQVLKQVNFNKTKAAKILNIDRKTLYNKMKAINSDLI